MEIVERPWGTFKIIYETPHTKVKEIRVNPGEVLSYQSHEKRREDWIITEGSGFVVLDGIEEKVKSGDHVRIEEKVKHRIGSNTDDGGLVFIEVQTGTYFGEDDIIRYEDIYGRNS